MASSRIVLKRQERIQEYFSRDPERRFYLEDYCGRGGQGIIFKVKYVNDPLVRALVLKVSSEAAAKAETEHEAQILKLLQGCRHIVHMQTVKDDPLAPAGQEQGWGWIFLDEVENGTLIDFMRRAKDRGIEVFPNRLLWRIFLCMIRACIAMAWPRDAPNENEKATKTQPITGLTHGDMHGGNLMFGSILETPEHNLTPILKLIDFGESRLWANNMHSSGVTCQQFNIKDIGLLMAALIILRTEWRYTGDMINANLSGIGRPPDTESPASRILPDPQQPNVDPCPDVDINLRRIVGACLATNAALRPTLEELEAWALGEVSKPDTGSGMESDSLIKRMVRDLVFNAQTR